MMPIGSPSLGTGIETSFLTVTGSVDEVVSVEPTGSAVVVVVPAARAAWSAANCLRRLDWASEVWMPVPHSW